MENEEMHKKVNEPEMAYHHQKRLAFFSSFEDELEAQFKYWRELTPEQRLEHHRVISYYAFSSIEKYQGNRLIFD